MSEKFILPITWWVWLQARSDDATMDASCNICGEYLLYGEKVGEDRDGFIHMDCQEMRQEDAREDS